MTSVQNVDELKAKLVGHYGTSAYYHQLNKKSVYTDGAKEMFELAGAWWLYDFIQFQIQPLLFQRRELDKFYFQIVSKDNEASLTLTCYRGEVLWEHKIDYTDFPEGDMLLYVSYDGKRIITCIPNED